MLAFLHFSFCISITLTSTKMQMRAHKHTLNDPTVIHPLPKLFKLGPAVTASCRSNRALCSPEAVQEDLNTQ